MGKNYIGGTPKEARIKYLKQNPDLLSTIAEISQRYKIDPSLVAYRLSKEGIVDSKIKDYNAGKDSEKINGTNLDKADLAYSGFGTDWLASRIKSGNVKLNRVIPFGTLYLLNEKKEEVNPPHFYTNYDNIEGVVAQLKKIEEEVSKDFSNDLTIDKSAAIMAYYNRGRSGGRNYIKNKGSAYLDYKVPEEFKLLLQGVSPSLTPIINYGDSENFKSSYNYFKNREYSLPTPVLSPRGSYELIFHNTPQELDYINRKRNQDFLNYLGITESLADSIMNAATKPNYFILQKKQDGGTINNSSKKTLNSFIDSKLEEIIKMLLMQNKESFKSGGKINYLTVFKK